ncbi:MAG: putative cytochrome c oxidase subunit protein [Rubritepida sp.]|nr:putative cytochrome c oxidase subunit protein [Rubritepida sp.]
MRLVPVRDVSHLPTYAHGPKNPLWWGNLGFIVIEGLGFLFAIAVYLYLWSQGSDWPIGPPPDLLWPSLLTGLMVLSEIPNTLTKHAAQRQDLRGARIGVWVMGAIGVLAIGLRVMEFATLEPKWNTNAYGSVLWLIIGVHTTHLVADVFETLVIGVLLLAGPLDLRNFADVEDNQGYWDFVVVAWLLVYATVYWLPRILPASAL